MLIHISASILFLITLSAIANDNPDIQTLMTEKQFNAAGLNTLSKDQLKVLNHWLLRYTVQGAPVLLNTNAAIKASAKVAIKNKIDGVFNGWNGKTRFTLKNGQVWETRYNKRYRYYATDPEVKISKNFLGFYTLTIVETGQFIGVRRIK